MAVNGIFESQDWECQFNMDGQDKQDKNMVSECLRFTQIFAD